MRRRYCEERDRRIWARRGLESRQYLLSVLIVLRFHLHRILEALFILLFLSSSPTTSQIPLLTFPSRNVRQRLRHALLPLPIRRLLLSLPHCIPALPPPDRLSHELQTVHLHRAPSRRPSRLHLRHPRCGLPHLPQLSHSQASLGRLLRRPRICRHLVSIHHVPAKRWMDRLGVELGAFAEAEVSRPHSDGGSSRRWLGSVGGTPSGAEE